MVRLHHGGEQGSRLCSANLLTIGHDSLTGLRENNDSKNAIAPRQFYWSEREKSG